MTRQIARSLAMGAKAPLVVDGRTRRGVEASISPDDWRKWPQGVAPRPLLELPAVVPR
jgi:hypothetical protein